jgi:hypothetical protein
MVLSNTYWHSVRARNPREATNRIVHRLSHGAPIADSRASKADNRPSNKLDGQRQRWIELAAIMAHFLTATDNPSAEPKVENATNEPTGYLDRNPMTR